MRAWEQGEALASLIFIQQVGILSLLASTLVFNVAKPA